MKITLFTILVLLAGQSFAQRSKPSSDSIPMSINNQNTIAVKGIFNGLDTLNLNFDSGTTQLVLINTVLKNKVKTSAKLYDTPYQLRIGKTNYETKVYDAQLTGHGTDGRFGWDLFTGKIVELNYDEQLMIVHDALPYQVKKSNGFTKLKMVFIEDLIFVSGEIKQSGIAKRDLFLFDTGYQRTAMLDHDQLRRRKFPTEKMQLIKTVIMRGAQGNEIPVSTANLEALTIEKYHLENVPVQQTTTNKPVKGMQRHILGNEVLKRFNVVLDFQKNIIYLKPNHLFNDPYIDQKKVGS